MSSMRISSSVGIGGKNNPNDIKAVQTALNKLIKLIPPTKPLKVDGMLGRTPANSNTVAVIKLFQRKVVGIISPDGCVDANGRTHRKINEKLMAVSALNTHLNFSMKGINLLKSVEEFKSTPYDDQNGNDITNWTEGATVGYGHLIPKNEWEKYKGGISKSEAETLFIQDLAPFVRDVKKHVKVQLTQQQFDALVIFIFNIGTPNFKSSSALKLINDPSSITSYANLEAAWKAWNKSQGKVMNGLINRRKCEWNIYSLGVYAKW